MIQIPEFLANYTNIILIVVLLLTIFLGYKTGAVRQIIGLVGTLLCLFLANLITPLVANQICLINDSIVSYFIIKDKIIEKLNYWLVFFICFIVLLIILKIVTFILNKILELPVLKQLNGILGSIIALIKMFIILVVISFIVSLPIFENGKEIVDNSALKYCDKVAEMFFTDVFDINEIKEEQQIDIKEEQDSELSLNGLLGLESSEDITLEKIMEALKNSNLTFDDVVKYAKENSIDLEELAKEFNISIEDIKNYFK